MVKVRFELHRGQSGYAILNYCSVSVRIAELNLENVNMTLQVPNSGTTGLSIGKKSCS